MIKLLFTLLTTSLASLAVSAAYGQTMSPKNFRRLVHEGVNANALRTSLKAYKWAESEGKVKKHIMTLVDFDKPSNQKRLWVIDMRHKPNLLYTELVTHGHNSGGLYARHFSNVINSHESSVGAMIASENYYGKYGLSVRIDGIEKGLNNHVRVRDIVFHRSAYATPAFLRRAGRLGRSWGCFAIAPRDASKIFKTIGGGSFVFAYTKALRHDPDFA